MRIYWKIVSAIAASLMLAGCGPSLTPLPELGIVTSQGTETILVSTSRQKYTGKDAKYQFNALRSDKLSFGEYVVSIPDNHAPGELTLPRGSGNPQTQFTLYAQTAHNGQNDFVANINSELAQLGPEDQTVLIFIHGYNVPFANGIYSTAQIKRDFKLDVVPVHYSWPSASRLVAYAYDRESAYYARDGLVETMELIAKSNAKKIILLAHSMGNVVLMEALRDLNLSNNQKVYDKIDVVVMAAPDVDLNIFEANARTIGKLPQPFFVLTNEKDKALFISSRLRGRIEPRLGEKIEPDVAAEYGICDYPLTNDDSVASFVSHSGFRISKTLQEIISTKKHFREISASDCERLKSGG